MLFFVVLGLIICFIDHISFLSFFLIIGTCLNCYFEDFEFFLIMSYNNLDIQ